MEYGSIATEQVNEANRVAKRRLSSLLIVALLGAALASTLLFTAWHSAGESITQSNNVINTVAFSSASASAATGGNSAEDVSGSADPTLARDRALYARKLSQALAVAEQNTTQPQVRVEVGVYYEMGCPYCRDFLLNDLWAVWTAEGVPQVMDLLLVPYGNTKETRTNDTVTFKCQHGIDECKADMVQACAINMYPQSSVVPFVRCMSKSEKYLETTEDCARANNMDYSALSDCVNTNGTRYLHQMGLLTHSLSPKMQGTPWVTINSFPLEAGDDVLRIICKLSIGLGPVPAGCQNLPERTGGRCWRAAAVVDHEANSPTITLE